MVSALEHSWLFCLSCTFPFNPFSLEVRAESSGVRGAEGARGWELTRVAPSHVPQAPQEEQPGGFV